MPGMDGVDTALLIPSLKLSNPPELLMVYGLWRTDSRYKYGEDRDHAYSG